MEKNNQIVSQREAQNDIIELGVASIETKGPGDGPEPTGNGQPVIPGLAEE
jgi:hypothetical protein